MHDIYLWFVGTFIFFSKHWPMVLVLFLSVFITFILPIIILLKILKADSKNCKMKREEHAKEMELKQAQIDYYNKYLKEDTE